MASRLPSLRQIVRDTDSLIARSVGTSSVSDSGYFGPHSIAWKIHRAPSHGIGGIASLLVEALHPVAMAAVDQHSTYRDDPWLRANRTSEYVYTIVFGSRATADSAATQVREIHKHVRGVDPVTGRQYRADDGDLLMWIHCAGLYSTLCAFETYTQRLSDEEADRYVNEMRTSGELVGLDPDSSPATRAELESYMSEIRPELQMTPPAAEVLDLFLKVGMSPAVRPFWAMHIVGAIGVLPRWAREMYDVPRSVPQGAIPREAVKWSLRGLDIGMWTLPGVRKARRHLRSLAEAGELATSP